MPLLGSIHLNKTGARNEKRLAALCSTDAKLWSCTVVLPFLLRPRYGPRWFTPYSPHCSRVQLRSQVHELVEPIRPNQHRGDERNNSPCGYGERWTVIQSVLAY